jgi:hypothetical protein
LRDLTQHLTARADDSHAAPVQRLLREILFLGLSSVFQTRVRFFALHRIKPHAPLLVRAPVNSFRLRHGLPGYLILFAPHALAPQRQAIARKPLSPLVFFHISTHFTATCGIPFSPPSLYRPTVSTAAPRLSPGISQLTCRSAYAPFTPSESD